MAKRPRSYAWALHLEVADVSESELSEQAAEGLDYARDLAEDAETRRKQNINEQLRFPPLTLGELAERDGTTSASIGRKIAAARRELFGDISDSAIYKRLERHPLAQTPPRLCAESGCDCLLDDVAHRNRRYCPQHATPAARVRRCRRGGGSSRASASS
jgi:hypothetical protein